MKRITYIALVFAFVLLSSGIVAAQDHSITFFRGDGVGGNETLAYGINDWRQVSGTVGGEVGTGHGFIWEDGKFEHIFTFGPPTPPFLQDTNVFGINNLGQTVGIHFGNAPGESAVSFLREKHGAFTVLRPVQGKFFPLPLGINDSGKIVGSYIDTSVNATFGFVRLRGGKYIKISYPGSVSTSATAINEQGEITGSFKNSADFDAPSIGFLYRDGRFVRTFQCRLNGVPQSTLPAGINNWGQIVGRCGPLGQQTNFLRDRFGKITFIDTSEFSEQAFINGINNRGDVVGSFPGPRPLSQFSFVIFRATKPF